MSEIIDWQHWNAINRALQRYADAFDRADLPALLDLFAPEAVWDHGPDHVLHGREAIGAFLSERFAAYTQTSHHIGPPAVTRGREPSSFEAVAYLIATHVLHDGGSYTGYGRYLTTFRETETGLLITRHAVVAHVTHGASPSVNQLVRIAGRDTV